MLKTRYNFNEMRKIEKEISDKSYSVELDMDLQSPR